MQVRQITCALTLCGLVNVVSAQDALTTPPGSGIKYSPYPEQTFPNQVLFGDTHLHTAFSADAGLVGALLTPDDAYRYARGEVVTSNTGLQARLARPLDFLVVTDHAENLGLPAAVLTKDPVLTATEWGRQIIKKMSIGGIDGMTAAYEFWLAAVSSGNDPLAGTDFAQTMWERATESADANNLPGAFTAMIGFEWTSQPNGANMHRNVIYRGGKAEADQVIPISTFDTDDPERLWDWMEAYETKTGGRILAIPHGGNLSNGLMFDDVTLTDRRPLDAEYAARRMRWEPLYEITQIKGDGEAHPALSTEDEFADYETWDNGSFGPEPKTPDMLPREYAREAFKRGMAYEAQFGVNPFKFGVVGSTDAHTGLTAETEDNFYGKVAVTEPTADPIRFDEAITGRVGNVEPQRHWMASAAGLVGVWSRENTREAIWDSLAAKEVFATTGTRMTVRVFGGFDFTAADLNRPDFARYGYENGVPMGSDLNTAPRGKTPRFLVRVMRDVDGANLDRVQMVKGWLNADGSTGEKVYDIAWSDDRVADAEGKLPPVGNTVNARDASYSNSIGSPYLATFWEDPHFDRSQRAFYYVRVIEIPTPRWTTFDAKVFDVAIPEGANTWIDERAYTSPIWYNP
ncbi:DUF3604 domain-containing protein [Pseudohalioglobus lutimaris]|uniref:DUF3604 domain-containing protein n=1 Tax=Pseudohalioglobus lutimaris TaxID=1737061 RepID=A0A2N5WYE1_9GAMM|nr:DUF3604 domain-containing protein [Pseudohalioglobus lutimaris]PLW67250.1 hypothetical protein C0039_17965 [Pseudohalioglobus lutimaris]